MDTDTLRSAVSEAFATTGAETPGWPDPHAGTDGPSPEEYSRCLEPGKYRIVGARADAWVRVLTNLGLAETEPVDEVSTPWRDGRVWDVDRAIRLRPLRVDAMPLLLGWASLDGAPDVEVYVGAGDPAVLVVALPQCGCDACDDGSARLLAELDRHVVAVVTGELVHVTTKGGRVMSTGPREWSAGGTGELKLGPGDVERMLGEARAGTSPHPVVAGKPWW